MQSRRSGSKFDENTVKIDHPKDKRCQFRDGLHDGLMRQVQLSRTKSWLLEAERNFIRKFGDAGKMTV